MTKILTQTQYIYHLHCKQEVISVDFAHVLILAIVIVIVFVIVIVKEPLGEE